MNHIYWYPHSKKAEFYKLLLDYDDSLERDLADYGTIWYESWTRNLMVWDYKMPDRIASMVISKYFWFIQRLVDNDKIDESKIDIHWFSFYESVLMELAIQDNPIEFLCSVLK